MLNAPAVLVGDIGGTNARLSVLEGDCQSAPVVLRCSNFSSLEQLLDHAIVAFGVKIGGACIGIAGPVIGDEVNITNRGWTFSIESTRKALRLDRFLVVNDFAALAAALPTLDANSLVRIGGGGLRPSMPQLIIGPGTGLGMAVVLRGDSTQPLILSGEGGYVSLPVHTEREIAAWQVLRARHGRVSAERVLCGSGIVELHKALAAVDATDTANGISSYDIVERGVADAFSRERETLEMFLGLLGDVSGNAALTCGARGGIFLNGELLIHLAPLIPGSSLRERLEGKGRGRPFLADVGTFMITDRFAALKGCARILAGDEYVSERPGGDHAA